MMDRKILVIGGTGAQGAAVTKALLEATPPFAVRILTRNPDDPAVLREFANYHEVEFAKGT
jgi:uncharacterized protein YbjT (DUF2867 family)